MININGHIYEGQSVSMINGQVWIDGKKMEDGVVVGVNTLKIEGVLMSLTTDMSVDCSNVAGNVSAGGSVNCDEVAGSVSAGGSVNCGDVEGSINAGGSVRAKRVKS